MRQVAPPVGGGVSTGGDDDGLTAEYEFRGDILFQIPTATVQVAGQEIKPTSITVNTNRYSAAAQAEIEGLWDSGPPRIEDEVTVDLNRIRVFTGSVRKPSPGDGDSFTVTAMDNTKKFLKTKFDINFDQAYLGEMVDKIMLDFPDIEYEYDFPRPVQGSPNFDNMSVAQMLNQVSKWGGVLWWVDAYNKLWIKEAEPTIHQLGAEFVESEPSAGKKESPYKKVIVTGESPVSQGFSSASAGGYGTEHVIAKRKVRGSAGSGEPVYRYESKQVRTNRQAQIAAEAILREFKMQRAEGNVAVIGEGPPIRPFDVIEMPDEFHNEQYLVSGIKHTFNDQDGMISDINCGGLIDD